MKCRTPLIIAGAVLLLAVSAAVPAAGQQGENVLTVIDGSGKEHIFKVWKFTAGAKNLSWLVPAPVIDKASPKEKVKGPKTTPKVGPEAFEFTEGKGVVLVKRVLAYIPFANIRTIDYEAVKDALTVRVATSAKEADDVVLQGPLRFKATNLLTIEVTTDLGELGTATVKFQRGGEGRGLKSLRFSSPRAIDPPPQGPVATVKQAAKNQPSFSVVDLKALYVMPDGLLQASPILYFKDTIKLDLSKVRKMVAAGTSGVDFDVTLTSGQQNSLTLIERPKGPDGKTEMRLDGLVGRFAGGYRHFPLATVGEVEFEMAK